MLLSCCFRYPKNKNQKNEKQKETQNYILQENEDSTSPSGYLLNRTELNTKTVHSATLRCSQEKHPPSKEEKRLLKQKSQESLHHRDVTLHWDSSKRQSIIDTDKSNAEQTIPPYFPSREESLSIPTDRLDHAIELGTEGSIPKGSSLSLSNPIENYTTSNNSLISISESGSESGLTSSPLKADDGVSSSSLSLMQLQSSIATTKQNLPENGGIGMEEFPGSDILNDENLLEEQKEEYSKEKQMQESVIKQIREEYALILENLKDENKIVLEEANRTHSLKLHHEMLRNKKENDEAILNAEKEANKAISKLNQQIVLERQKIIVEQQENARNLEEEFQMKERRLNESLKHIEEREQAWQNERADVLTEVQRLKSEAIRMVKILAMEYEEDNLSEDKKRSLSQEVYSLQLVVEMRTGEVRNLREQLARATQELEQAEIVKEKLGKATTRIEDLNEQLKRKNRLEKQLSVENSQMEMTAAAATGAAKRMSQNVEELQWRIRNNFDLPVEVFPSQNNKILPPSGFDRSCSPNLKSSDIIADDQSQDHYQQITPLPRKRSESKLRKKSFFSVSPEMMDATSKDFGDSFIDFSPSSDEVAEYGIKEDLEGEDGEYHHNSDRGGIDGDSLDEGLGDISSDCETAESPVPNIDNLDNHNMYNSNICEQAIIISAKSPVNHAPLNLEHDPTSSCPIISQVKERRPSRISFETEL